ncbi:MAG TPA: hypothetical protein VL614_14835 [Acetobacteraceae bacterium]|jgi:hypothetical protein|nr:hypothetical protein [Acetobacteraceae bacterium]
MNRSIWYSQQQWRSFDITAFEHDVLMALAATTQELLGSTTTVIAGISATQTSPASLTINLSGGNIYQLADADAVAVGTIPQDTTTIMQQGEYDGGQLTFSAASIPAGQSQYFLVQAQFSQSDVVRSGDPNGGVSPFYNTANPAQPLNGQGGLGNVSPSERQGKCIVQVISGVAATTGSETPPTPTGGWVPLYLIVLTNGQTQITNAEILTAGPSVGVNVPTNYPFAPFLAGLLNSHHSGNPGQAPKINLATEVQGVLPAANVAKSGGMQAFTSTGNLTVPPNIFAVEYEVWGPGGGGGGSLGSNSGGAGGSGGGYCRGVASVTPGQVILVTIGTPGAGGTTTPTNGGNGTTSSFGPFGSATGGGGGGAGNGVVSVSVGAPGNGAGGAVTIQGSLGTFPTEPVSGTISVGQGGSAFGTPANLQSNTTIVSNGVAGVFPGGGGCGGALGGAGGAGAGGLCVVKW